MEKIMTKLQVAKKYRQEIKKLKREQDKLYRAAIKELGFRDNGFSWDYFHNADNRDYSKYCWENMFRESDNAPVHP